MPDPRGPDPDVPDLVAALEADLVSLAHAEADLDRDGEVAERIRIERGAVTLVDRLRGSRSNVEIELLGATGRVTGRLVDDGDGWVVLRGLANISWLSARWSRSSASGARPRHRDPPCRGPGRRCCVRGAGIDLR